jgi:tRNA/rRNA methyltransferase
VLVSPREPGVVSHPDAVAMASGADDVLASATIVDSIEAALAGTAFTVAMTARQREFGPPRLLPRAAVAKARSVLEADPLPRSPSYSAMNASACRTTRYCAVRR